VCIDPSISIAILLQCGPLKHFERTAPCNTQNHMFIKLDQCVFTPHNTTVQLHWRINCTPSGILDLDVYFHWNAIIIIIIIIIFIIIMTIITIITQSWWRNICQSKSIDKSKLRTDYGRQWGKGLMSRCVFKFQRKDARYDRSSVRWCVR